MANPKTLTSLARLLPVSLCSLSFIDISEFVLRLNFKALAKNSPACVDFLRVNNQPVLRRMVTGALVRGPSTAKAV